MKTERRFLETDLALAQEAKRQMVVGYAARFEARSDDLGGFTEIIMPGAFASALSGDVRALINHDFNLVLGRTRAGTLRLREDGVGLAVEIDLPETQAARDLAALMARGDVNQMSFGFTTARDEWSFDAERGTTRVIHEVGELFDVSVVSIPAYPQTEAALRGLEAARLAAAPTRPALRAGILTARAVLAGL